MVAVRDECALDRVLPALLLKQTHVVNFSGKDGLVDEVKWILVPDTALEDLVLLD